MNMERILILPWYLCGFLSCAMLLTRPSFAQQTFQRNSEGRIEETEEVKDGKRTRTIRSGKVKQRQGEARVGEIEDDEVSQVERRQKSLHLTSLGFGPFGSTNLGKGALMYGASVGWHWEVTTTGEIVAEIVGAANGNGAMINGALGFNFLPLTGDFSPIIGGEFGAGYGSGKDSGGISRSQGGFSAQGNLGLRLFRLSSTQMEIMGTYTTLLSTSNPNIYGIQLRVLY